MHTKARILIVDDDPLVNTILREQLKDIKQYEVHSAADAPQAYALLASILFDVVLLDINLPRVSGFEILKHIREHSPNTQVIMLTQSGDIRTAIKAIKEGAYDFLTKPHEFEELTATIARAASHKALLAEKEAMRSELDRLSGTTTLIAESPKMKEVLSLVDKVAPSDAFVFINGPSGSGKEVIAHLIHRKSQRADQPFLALNCASIPDTLLESELFGHEKGAFTNAHAMKRGLVEAAHNGTLFLDEVGDISPSVQPKLLRFLETQEFRRVGGTVTLKADVRIISATNKDIMEEVSTGRFREDLMYRLKVFTFELAPLSERKDDIAPLAEHFIAQKSKSKRLSTSALELLLSYDWPGNIRELKHVIEGALLLSQGDELQREDFKMNSRIFGSFGDRPQEAATSPAGEWNPASLEEMEKRHLQKCLEYTKFNRTKTAKILGITEKTLYLKIKKYNISVPKG